MWSEVSCRACQDFHSRHTLRAVVATTAMRDTHLKTAMLIRPPVVVEVVIPTVGRRNRGETGLTRQRAGKFGRVQLTVDQRSASAFPQIVVVAPTGEVDLASAGELRQGLERAESEASSGLVIDLRQVGFIDSTGIGELVGCHRRCREAGRALAFVVPEGTISKILKVTGMDSVFDIHADEESAAAAVSEGGPDVGASE